MKRLAMSPRGTSLGESSRPLVQSSVRLVALLGFSVVLVALTPRMARALAWPDVAERAERDLSAPDAATRRAAAREIALIGPPRGPRLAVAAMGDPDDEVRLAAAQAAVRLRAPGATEVAINWLSAPDARLRRAACEVARSLPSPRSIAPLARTVADPDADVRTAAAQALGEQASVEAVAPLLGRLDDSTPAVRLAVVAALSRLGDKRAVVPLVGKVEDSSAEVRQAVARALGELGDERASSALVLSLRDQSSEVRREALTALGRLHAADAIDAMAPFVSDRVASLRLAAVEAIGGLATPDAIRVLTAALGLGDDAAPLLEPTSVRSALVASGLVAVAPLHALLMGSPSPAAAASAAWVLGELHARSEAPVLVAALRRGVLPPSAALHGLAGAGTPADVPVVLEYVADPNPTVRAEALKAAAGLLDPNVPDGRAVEPLVAALGDPRPSVEERAAIARVLGRTGAPRAATLLARLVTAPDARLRLAAIDALGTLGPNGADESLLVALRSRDAEMRIHAAMALSEGGGGRARDALLAELESGDEVDRPAILTALGGTLSRAPADKAVRDLAARLALAAGPERDAILDAVGRAPIPSSVEVLEVASRSEEAGDRSTVAAMCAAHAHDRDAAARAAALRLARRLLLDADSGVRAQAAWALGTLGEMDDVARLSPLTSRGDPDTTTDATAAIGRIAGRLHSREAAALALCPLLPNERAFVRANALAGLALSGARCGDGSPERTALRDDPSDEVRASAALALAGRGGGEDERSRERCAKTDVSGFVAARCLVPPARPEQAHAALVYIVPAGAASPRPGASYAALLADGLLHAGQADRRGAFFDPAAPEGLVRLVSLADDTLRLRPSEPHSQ